MTHYHKIALLILDDKNNFLVCKKRGLDLYIMPGGEPEKQENDIEFLKRKVREQLNCEVEIIDNKFIGEYKDMAAENPNKDFFVKLSQPNKHIFIKLYQGKTIGKAKPSGEIFALNWINKNDVSNSQISPIIKNRIIPDLIIKKILT